MCVYMYVCTHVMLVHVFVNVDTHAMPHLWMSEDNLPESDKNLHMQISNYIVPCVVTFLLLLAKGRKISYLLSCGPQRLGHLNIIIL